MSIMELGALGEFVGAFVVVVTLMYITVQIRQNTRATRAQTVQDLNKSIAEYLLVQAQSSELGSAWAKAIESGYSTLDVREEFYVRGFGVALLYSFKNAHDQQRLGTITEEQWVEYRDTFNGVIQNWEPLKAIWEKYKHLFPQPFVQAAEQSGRGE